MWRMTDSVGDLSRLVICPWIPGRGDSAAIPAMSSGVQVAGVPGLFPAKATDRLLNVRSVSNPDRLDLAVFGISFTTFVFSGV